MPELSGHMLYFAYGDDLARDAFLRVCPGAEWFGPARMEGHRLVFTAEGRANVKAESGSTVWGALWMVPAALLPSLDSAAGEGFARATRRIVSPAGPRTEATVYLSKAPVAPLGDRSRLEALLAAAKENRLPEAYMGELQAAADCARGGKDSR